MGVGRVKKYEIRLVTPAFIAGADQQPPEIRAPSIRGCLRWWLRLGARAAGASLEQIEREEDEMFGSTERGQRLILRVRDVIPGRKEELSYQAFGFDHKYLWFPLRPERDSAAAIARQAVAVGTTFRLEAIAPPAVRDSAEALARLDVVVRRWVLLGGIGMRSRRGAGSLWFERLPGGARLPSGKTEIERLLASAREPSLKSAVDLRLSPRPFPSWRKALEDVGNHYRGQRQRVRTEQGRKALPVLGWPIMKFPGGDRLVVDGEDRGGRGERMASPVMLKIVPDGAGFRWLLVVIKEPFVDLIRSGEGEVRARDVLRNFGEGFERATPRAGGPQEPRPAQRPRPPQGPPRRA